MSEVNADDLVRRFIIRKYRAGWNGAVRGPGHHLMQCPEVDVRRHDMDEGPISDVTPDPCTDIWATMGCPHQEETGSFHWTDYSSMNEVIADLIAMEEAERNPPPPPPPPAPEPPLFEYVQVPRAQPGPLLPQPAPVVLEGAVSIHDLVAADAGRHGWDRVVEIIGQRKRIGLAEYGVPLVAGNGRDALTDALEELADAAVYLRQAVEEGHGNVAGQMWIVYGLIRDLAVKKALRDIEEAA